MAFLFSSTTNLIYDTRVSGTPDLSDLVELSKEQFGKIMEGRQAGMCLSSDADGNPVLSERVMTNAEKRIELSLAARRELAKSDAVAQRAFKEGAEYNAAWRARDFALRNIVNGADTASTELPDYPRSSDGSIAYP